MPVEKTFPETASVYALQVVLRRIIDDLPKKRHFHGLPFVPELLPRANHTMSIAEVRRLDDNLLVCQLHFRLPSAVLSIPLKYICVRCTALMTVRFSGTRANPLPSSHRMAV